MRIRILILVAFVSLLATSLTGCLGTSAPFKTGAAAAGPLLSEELAAYVAGDISLPTADKAALTADVDAFRIATADRKTMDYATVAAAWVRVRAAYLAYLQADPTLSATDKQLRNDTALQLDALIAAEQSRHAAAGSP
jgi:hypothetical protein